MRAWQPPESHPRLVEVLAVMLRSALAWEEEQRPPPAGSGLPHRLTSTSSYIHCSTHQSTTPKSTTIIGGLDNASPASKESVQ
jgi:hypothetical protein